MNSSDKKKLVLTNYVVLRPNKAYFRQKSNLCRRNRNLNVCLNKKLFVEALKYDVSVYIIAIM